VTTGRSRPAREGRLDGIEHRSAALPDGTQGQPLRTCTGCRRRDARSVLLRLVVVDVDGAPVVVLDSGRTMPGRGAWLHPDLECLALARRRSAVARSLHLAGPVDLTGIVEQVRALCQDS
jgi:predicted RNA-binding protein YlxR (DUF448 family)